MNKFISHTQQTRTLLVALSLAYLEMSFVVKGPGTVILLFRLKYKTSVVCHNVYTQKEKIARRDRPHILASNRCETFENLLHIDIAPLRSTLSGILHSKNWTMIFIGIRGPWLSLRKRPFLLALRRWGRFARRNVCDSATEIPYWWRKICPESGQKRWLVDGVVTLF